MENKPTYQAKKHLRVNEFQHNGVSALPEIELPLASAGGTREALRWGPPPKGSGNSINRVAKMLTAEIHPIGVVFHLNMEGLGYGG